MAIYKVIATFGIENVLDSRIYWKLEAAHEAALEWLDNNEDCDKVEIVVERPDAKTGLFRSVNGIRIKRRK